VSSSGPTSWDGRQEIRSMLNCCSSAQPSMISAY
jgi:hypothetical protein